MNRTIKQNLSHRGRLLIAACALLISHAAFAQQAKPAVSAAAKPAAEEKESALPNSGTAQGIKVHGHWVINIKNPDGTLVEHREFENSITSSGQQILIGLLAGYYVPGDYDIQVAPVSGNSPCLGSSGAVCTLVRSLSTYPGISLCAVNLCSTGLTSTYNLTSPNFSLVLSGTATANNNGTIGVVSTGLNPCTNSNTLNPTSVETSSPASCVSSTTGLFGPLTSTTITPITVISGQLIQITVTISFS